MSSGVIAWTLRNVIELRTEREWTVSGLIVWIGPYEVSAVNPNESFRKQVCLKLLYNHRCGRRLQMFGVAFFSVYAV